MTNDRYADWNEVPLALTVAEAAAVANVHEQTVRAALKSKKLPARKIGREWRINKSDLMAYLGENAAEYMPGGLIGRVRYGHATGFLREAFLEWVDQNWNQAEPQHPGEWLLGQLWNCTDIMPHMACQDLDMETGSTYAQAVRKVKAELENED